MCHGQIISDAIRKARREHRCDDCGRIIEPGKRYQVQAQASDGIQVWKGCSFCASANRAGWEEHGDDMCYGDRREGYREDAREFGWKAYRAIVAKAKEALFGARVEGG